MMTMSTEGANGCEYNLPFKELQEKGRENVNFGHRSQAHMNSSTGVPLVF